MASNDYIEKDLGIVTAYGECVAGGYRGTRAEFQQLLARMANSYLTYNDLNDKPSINGVTLQGNKTTEQLNIQTSIGTTDYSALSNKPSINNVTLSGNKSLSDLGIASTTALDSQKNYSNLTNKPSINGVTLDGNKTTAQLNIQTSSGTTDYSALSNKPSINNVTLSGNKSLSDLGIASTTALESQKNYSNLTNKPSINGVTLDGNKTTAQLNIQSGTSDYSALSNKPAINSVTLTGNKSLSDLGIASATALESQKNYNNLTNRPKINGITLYGDLSLADLGNTERHDDYMLVNQKSSSSNILSVSTMSVVSDWWIRICVGCGFYSIKIQLTLSPGTLNSTGRLFEGVCSYQSIMPVLNYKQMMTTCTTIIGGEVETSIVPRISRVMTGNEVRSIYLDFSIRGNNTSITIPNAGLRSMEIDEFGYYNSY